MHNDNKKGCFSFFSSKIKKIFFFAAVILPLFLMVTDSFSDGNTAVGNSAAYIEDIGMHRSISDYDLPGLKKTISVDFRGMDIVEVFKFLAVEGDLNIITSADVKGPVNLFIEKISVGNLMEMLFSMYNLVFKVEGNVIQIFADKMKQPRQTAIYQLKNTSAAKVGEMLGNVKSSIGKIVYDDSTGTLVLIDSPKKIEEMGVIINKIAPVETRVFKLKYAKVKDVKDEVAAILTAGIGSLRTDERTNVFVVKDLAYKLDEVANAIAAFDQKTKEVFIEAKIVQVTLSDTYKWGVDWNKLVSNAFGSKIQITPAVSLPLGLTNFGKISISKTGSTNLDVVLEMLSSVGETKILSNPHIAIEDGKEASLNVITKQPYSQTTTTTTDAATTEATEFTFVDVGVKLNVTPHINDDGYINMIIKPEVSSITSFFPDSTSENRVPVVETSNAETTVLVKDGVTIIIAGMIKDIKTKSINKVPLVGDVPVLGRLFRNVSDEIQHTETIVFLTPRIITGDNSYLLERYKKKERKGLRILTRGKERKGLKE